MQIYRKFLALGSQRTDQWCLMEKCLLFQFSVILSPVSHTSTTQPTRDFKGTPYRYVPQPWVPSKPCGWHSPWESSSIQAAPMPTCNLGSCKYLSHSSLYVEKSPLRAREEHLCRCVSSRCWRESFPSSIQCSAHPLYHETLLHSAVKMRAVSLCRVSAGCTSECVVTRYCKGVELYRVHPYHYHHIFPADAAQTLKPPLQPRQLLLVLPKAHYWNEHHCWKGFSKRLPLTFTVAVQAPYFLPCPSWPCKVIFLPFSLGAFFWCFPNTFPIL